jgi:hypothetical protein
MSQTGRDSLYAWKGPPPIQTFTKRTSHTLEQRRENVEAALESEMVTSKGPQHSILSL